MTFVIFNGSYVDIKDEEGKRSMQLSVNRVGFIQSPISIS